MNEERLTELDFKTPKAEIDKNYSRFIRSMRLLLPLLALGLTVIVITWPQMDSKIVTIQKDELLPNTDLAENELINPRFQSTDTDLNPYTVTAKRAIQNQQNPDLVKLDTPKGNMTMKDGTILNVKASSGSYEQTEEKLFLENNVMLNHQSGYILNTQELRVDLKKGQAFSDKDVTITGTDGTIQATGLKGDLDNEVLIFKGPATLTLNPKNTLSIPSQKTKRKTDEADNAL
ncbi:MAG: LPS export ABC transporter periplasmic protein LptC [Micavibrio sp.]|nr:LPS export ABC transporter periplasmic protein LptC [Micavibrio sp.]|tara:strand:- start:759 stop:1454 length:696 start_codon:yes stop_codon:yes gene_type:complete